MYFYVGDEEDSYDMLLEAKTIKENINRFDNLRKQNSQHICTLKNINSSGTFPTKSVAGKRIHSAYDKG